jgi:hypothetical protein
MTLYYAFTYVGAGLLLGCIPMLLFAAWGGPEFRLRWRDFVWLVSSGLIMMVSHTLLAIEGVHNKRVIEALKAEGRLQIIPHDKEPRWRRT